MRKSHLLYTILVVICLTSCKNKTAEITELFPVQISKQFGFIDRSGKMVITPQFAQAGCFVDGLALVALPGDIPRWGYADKSGSLSITPKYLQATSFSEGIAFTVAENWEPAAIDPAGKIKFSLPLAEAVQNFHEGMAAFSVVGPVGERWGFIDKNGKVAIQPQFAGAGYFSGSLCGIVNDEGKWGFIDKRGDIKIACQYDNVSAFDGPHAKVAVNGKWGVIDRQGKYVISPQYVNMDLDGDRFLMEQGDKWGWVDAGGKTIIPATFADAFQFNGSDIAAVRNGSKWGYVDRNGKYVLIPQYDFAFGFDGDIALVRVADKMGFINKKGDFAVKPQFEDISMDYYIRFFAKTSSFYEARSEKNTPRHIAYKWLTDFYHLDYDDARKISTEETKTLLQQISSLTEFIQDSSRRQMMNVKVGIKDIKEEAGKAIITYTASDNPGKDQILYLISKDGKWLVQFSKNQLSGSDDEVKDNPQSR